MIISPKHVQLVSTYLYSRDISSSEIIARVPTSLLEAVQVLHCLLLKSGTMRY